MTIAIAGLLGLVVLLVAAALLLSNRPAVREALRPRLESLLSAALDLDVRIEQVAGLGPWQGVRVTGATLSTKDGSPLITAGELHVGVGVARLLPPRISVAAEGRGIAVDLVRAPDGEWNVVRAFSAGNDDTEESAPPPSWLGAIELTLHDGTVRVRGLVDEPIVLSAVDGEALLELGTPGRLTVEQLAARLGGASDLSARGWLDLGAPSALDVRVELHPLAAQDVRLLGPQLVETAAFTGTVDVSGSLDAPDAEAHLSSGPATIDLWGKSTKNVSAGTHVDASWQVLALDPAQLVAGAPPASLSGGGSVDAVLGEGWPSALAADARLWSTSVAGIDAEWLTAQARREGERIVLDAQLAAPGGAATVDLSSWIGVADAHPAGAELRFALLQPGRLPDPVPAALADSELRGRLVVTADRTLSDDRVVQAELRLEPGRLRGVALDQASARASFEAGVASLDELRVAGGATRLLAWGWAQLEGAPEARHLRAGVVGPVDLGLVPGARGKAVVNASAWGTLAAIDAEASLRSEGSVVLPGATGAFTIAARAGDVASARPSADVTLDARLAPTGAVADALGPASRDLDLDLTWRRPASGEPTLLVRGSADAAEGAPDQVSLALAAREPDGRKHAVAGLVERRGETVAVRLDDLRVAPPRGPAWTLAQPARLSYAPDRIAAQGVELASRAGRVTLDGELVRDGRNDLSLNVAGLDLAAVCEALGLAQACGGDLDAALRLAGSTRSPDVSGTLRVQDLALSGQTYGAVDLTLATEERLVVRGRVGSEPFGPLTLVARLPLAGGWPAPTLNPKGPLDATLAGDDIRLAGFQTFARDAVSELAGQADVQVTASGTLATPEFAGGITATGVRLGLVATGARWQDGRLRLSFVGQSVRLDELTFRDGQGGTVSGGGALALAGEGEGVSLAIDLNRFAVAARPDVDALASGTVRIGGSVASPRVTGNVRIDTATIRPALLPGGSGPPPDPTIHFVPPGDAPPEARERAGGDALADAVGSGRNGNGAAAERNAPSLFDRVSMLVTVRLGDPVVVQRMDAYVRLGGEVYVTREPGDELRVSGQISADRGWYMFRGRRIVLQSAFVSFSGETPINPYLTVTATYQAPEHLVTIRVEGTARKPELELSSEPALDQSDVLALLLFGRTTSQLTGGQGTELRQEAIGILASYVAPDLEQSLMDTFGLASLTFQLPTGTSYGSVGVGRYLGDDIFISIGQTFGGPQGGTTRQLGGLVGSSVTVQYYLTPNVTVQTSSSTEGESALDAIWHNRY
jgi:translocation and assembly module TamB